jgi:[lysine-biosynthesis-protein LysW]--L-2-aminoadipate ligase
MTATAWPTPVETTGSGAPIRLGVLVSHLREEEKLILAAARARGIETTVLQDRSLILDLTSGERPDVDLVLDRCVAHTRGSCALRVFDRMGVPTLNSSQAVDTCDDKVVMTAALAAAGVPTLRTAVAFSIESALQVGEKFGYPLIVKPVSGSWGRLLAKANSAESLRTLLEQKQQLGTHHHGVFYLQEYIQKPGRDIRSFVVGGEVLAASYRNAEHWITNVARGAVSTVCEVTPEIEQMSRDAAAAVGAEIAGVDLVETPEGLKVIEVNGGAEFKGLRGTTTVPIADVIVEHAIKKIASLKGTR